MNVAFITTSVTKVLYTMSNVEERPYIKIRSHIFYYDKTYGMHNGEVVDMVMTYNADGSITRMSMDDFIKKSNRMADYYDSQK